MFSTISLNLGSLLLSTAIFVLAFTLGNCAMSLFRISLDDLLVPVATALGLGLLSILVFILGVLHGFKPPAFYGLISLLTLLFSKQLTTNFFSAAQAAKNFFSSRTVLPIRILVILFFGMFIYNSFIPDQFYDVLVYHLAIPQAYLVHGKLAAFPYNVHSAFPQTAEMLFTLGFGLAPGDNIPLLLQLGFAVLILITLVRLSASSIFLSAMLWASTPLVVENMRFAKSDTLFSLWVLMLFAVIWRSKEDQSLESSLLAGIFAGLAMSTKYTGILFALGFTALVLTLPAASPSIRVKRVLVYWTASLAILIPWMVKNWIVFKNPLYPFFQDLFGFVNMTQANWKAFKAEQSQYWLGNWQGQDLFKTFWKNSLEGFKYPSMNFIGPAWIAFFPLVLLRSPGSRYLRVLSIIIVLTLTVSSLQTTLARYFILPILPFFALAVSEAVLSGHPKHTGILKGFLFLGVALNLSGWFPLLERLSYCRTALWGLSDAKKEKLYPEGYLAASMFVNRTLPDRCKILFLGETRSHLFQKPLTAPSVHNEHLLSQLLNASNSSRDLYAELVGKGFTHILYNAKEFSRLKGYPMFQTKRNAGILLKEFWKNYLQNIYDSAPFTLYAISDKSFNEKAHQPFPRDLDAFFN